MLVASYSPILVAAAAAVALMAAFTGLSLTNGLSRLAPAERKAGIARAAIVLGGGVWSTHFVAMLALDLPVEVFYDPLATLASALIAILLAGAALILMHFGRRSTGRMAVAAVVMGLGVVAMHYVGMWGMRGCEPVFDPRGYVVSTTLAVAISFGALRTAYGERTARGLIGGAAIYALAILVMHFSAMFWTGFLRPETVTAGPGLVPNHVLALIVMLAAFLICGAFLLATATAGDLWREPAIAAAAGPFADATRSPAPAAAPLKLAAAAAEKVTAEAPAAVPAAKGRLPYQQDGRTFFARIDDIAAIRAEGHYTRLHCPDGELFCPMPINRLAEELEPGAFLRTHRSYLVNLRHVRGFERRKDQGACLFDPALRIPPVPVSRARVPDTMRALGI